MPFVKKKIPGLLIFEPEIFSDGRGYFFDSYSTETFKPAGINACFVQDSQSLSHKGVIRGLHYQHPPFQQAKLVRVAKGEILDVAVDLRKGSPTFGKWASEVLSGENKKQFFIPRGFAHGFLTLSKEAIVLYKFDNIYSPEHEAGIIYNDKDINIDWQVDEKDVLLSKRDTSHPTLNRANNYFVYGKIG